MKTPLLLSLTLAIVVLGEPATLEDLKEKAEAGNKDAQYQVGAHYLEGKSSVRELAMKWLIKASEAGHAGAQYLLGDLYHRSHFKVPGIGYDIDLAMKWYNRSAEAGDLKAQLTLVRLYGKGAKGVSKDTLLAEKWQAKVTEQYIRMAEEGDISAQYMLGYYYRFGKGGLDANRSLALKWHESAAMGGHKKAMTECYILYANKDRLKSYAWSLTSQYFYGTIVSGQTWLDHEKQLEAEAISRKWVKQISANMKAKKP